MARFLAMAFPILPGKEKEWSEWMHELRTTKYREFVASRKKLGVRERTFLQHTPNGDLVIVTLRGDDPAGAFAQFAQGDDDFTKWFIDAVTRLHGVDLRQPMTGPLPELLIDSKA